MLEAQIVQESLDRVRVLLVPEAGFTAALEGLLVANLRAKLGTAVEIRVERVDRVPRGPNGKFRSVVSHVRHLYPGAA